MCGVFYQKRIIRAAVISRRYVSAEIAFHKRKAYNARSVVIARALKGERNLYGFSSVKGYAAAKHRAARGNFNRIIRVKKQIRISVGKFEI